MPTFPRTLKPQRSTLPKVPTGLRSAGHSGKLQLRTTTQVGRMWEERWPPLKAGVASVEALTTWIEWAFQTEQIFDITHLLLPGSGKDPNGAGGGTPLVNGASQTGSSLVTDGWSASITGIVKAGDVIRIAGLNVLYRVRNDENSDGGGNVTLDITPPIPSGSSPADNAAITRSGCLIRAMIWDYTIPEATPGEHMAGLRVVFREVP